MKAVLLQENLSKGIAIVSRAVSSKSTLPILMNILIETVGEDKIRLTATNMEMTISCYVTARVERKGATTVPTKTFQEIISTLINPQLELDLDTINQNMVIYSGSSKNEIKCIEASEFPVDLSFSEEAYWEIKDNDLKELIKKSSISASMDKLSQPTLTGVLFVLDQDFVTSTTVDGHRMTTKEINLNSVGFSETVSCLIPSVNFIELSKIIGDSGEEVSIYVSKNRSKICFKNQEIEFTSNTIDGKYPSYKQIMPEFYRTKVIASAGNLLKVIKQAEIFSREESNVVFIRIKYKKGGEHNGEINISSVGVTGSNSSSIEADIEGLPVILSVNTQYLRELLSVVDTPNVIMENSGTNKLTVVRTSGEERFLGIVMPMFPLKYSLQK